jgi:hypothetical protein
VKAALNWGSADLEDAMEAAAALAWKAAFLITRHIRDFHRSPVQALMLMVFLKRFVARG